MNIIVLIPITCWLILFAAMYKKGFSWRNSFMSSCVICGVIVTLTTEILSFFTAFDFPWLVICWILVIIVAAFYYYIIPQGEQVKSPIKYSAPLFLYLVLATSACIVIITGLIAIIAPPNNWDSMTYHMPRVMHWIQNKTVAFYPTAITRQLFFVPLAEFTIAHLQILSGSDRFANLVQWFSMVGSLVGVSLIAGELGADVKGQVFTAVFAVTIPMGILQSSSTQNNYVVSFWLVCFVYYGLILKKTPNYWLASASGASLGLAVMTKGIAYLYATPFVLWFFASGIRKISLEKIIKYSALIAIIFLALNGCHYLRNYITFGNMLQNTGEVNDIFSFKVLLSNLSRNLAIHLGTPFFTLNAVILSSIEWFHRILGIDINSPFTTFGRSSFGIFFKPSEDSMGNPFHFVLIVIFFSVAFSNLKFRRLPNMMPYATATLGSFILLCFFLKWTPWHSRLHLPFFVLCSPVIGYVLADIQYRHTVQTIIICLLIFSIPFVFLNTSRPIFSTRSLISLVPRNLLDQQSKKVFVGSDSILVTTRTSQYFNNRPLLEQRYEKLANFINTSGCLDVGLQISRDDWEYPLWVLLKQRNPNIRIEHVNVRNKSGTIALEKFTPCIIVKNLQK